MVISSDTFTGGDGSVPVTYHPSEALWGTTLLLASRLPGVPVAVSKDRLRDIEALSGRDVDVIVADDAFQHRRMARDADIVLVDACCPFGNGWVAPAGILREPPAELSRASLVVITKSDQVSPERLNGLAAEIGRYVPGEKSFIQGSPFPTGRVEGRWRGETCPAPGTVLAFCHRSPESSGGPWSSRG